MEPGGASNINKSNMTDPPALSPTKRKLAKLQKKLLKVQQEAEEEDKQEAETKEKEEADAEWKHFLLYVDLKDAAQAVLSDVFGINKLGDLEEYADCFDVEELKSNNFTSMQIAKLRNAATYSVAGGKFFKGITLKDMKKFLHQVKPDGDPKDNSSTSSSKDEKGLDYYMEKANVDTIDPFSDDPADFEDYWKEVESRLGATRVGLYLTKKADKSKPQEDASSRTLYHIVNNAFRGCTVESEIISSYDMHGEDGYEAAKAVTSYYRSDAIRTVARKKIRAQLKKVKLKGDPQSFQPVGAYINEWKVLYRRLEAAGETWPDDKKRDEFLTGIVVDQSNPISQLKVGCIKDQDSLSFATVTGQMEKAAHGIFQQTEDESESRKVRRGTTNAREGSKSTWKELHIPDCLIALIKRDVPNRKEASKVIGNILRWKNFLVEHNRQPNPDEIDLKMISQAGNSKRKDYASRNNKTSGPGNGKSKKKSRRLAGTSDETETSEEKRVHFTSDEDSE